MRVTRCPAKQTIRLSQGTVLSGGGGGQIRNKEVDGWTAKVLRLHVKLQKGQGGSGTVYLGVWAGWCAGLA